MGASNVAVSLVKGQKISLEKEAGHALNRIVMGLGWDPVESKGFFGLFKGKKDIDLDASCLMFNKQSAKLVDVVWFQQLRSRCGSIQHTGDNLTGDGEGDDEQILVELNQVPSNVDTLFFVVNSFTGQSFDAIQNAFVRMEDEQTRREVARYDLSCQGSHTAQIMCTLYRHQGEWKMHAIGENASGRTFHELAPLLEPYL
jgi:tellurium resistance protein TerZ